MRRFLTRFFLAIGSLGLIFTLSAHGATQYTYDELGRLVKVVHTNGKGVRYFYDEVGNRTALSIDTDAELPVAIPTATASTILVYPLAGGGVVPLAVPGNAPPEATDDAYSVYSIGATFLPVKLNDTDPDTSSAHLFVSEIVTQPTKGTATVLTNSVRYDGTGQTGTDQLVYRVSDGVQTGTATVNLTIDLNYPPEAVDDAYTTSSSIFTFEPLQNDIDPEGDDLEVHSIVSTNGVTATIEGDDSVEIRAVRTTSQSTATIVYRVEQINPNQVGDTATVTINYN